MKAKEFYDRLSTLPNRGFKVISGKQHREIRLKKFNHIFCPITAVCYDLTGERYSTKNPDAANRNLKLHSDVMTAIMDASDGNWAPVVRKKLENALGL